MGSRQGWWRRNPRAETRVGEGQGVVNYDQEGSRVRGSVTKKPADKKNPKEEVGVEVEWRGGGERTRINSLTWM